MRTWLHLALWGAVFLGACSSGGGGGLASIQFVREAPEYSSESPGEALGPESSGGGEQGGSPGTNPGGNPSGSDASTSTPDGSVSVPDVNVPDIRVPEVSVPAEASTAGTCEDLQPCCDTLPSGSIKTQCQTVVDNGDDATCGSALTSLKNSGQCE